jgi:hypothetical protein
MRVSCPWSSPALQHTVHTPRASAASASAGTDSAAATRAERGSILNSRCPVVAAHTDPGPAASRTTGGSLVSMPGTVRLRRVTGSTPTTSPPAATQTTPRLTAMSSTGAVRAILVMPSAAAGRLLAVTAGGRVVAARGWVVDGTAGVPCWSSCGVSHRPTASRAPTRTTAADTNAIDERFGVKAAHLREHLAPMRIRRDNSRRGSPPPSSDTLTPSSVTPESGEACIFSASPIQRAGASGRPRRRRRPSR